MSHFIIWSKLDDVLRHAERAGEHAVRAADAARLERRLHDAVLVLLDRVGRAHLGAGRVLAVHAHHRRRLGGGGPVDLLEVDHRRAAVRAALLARLHARPAADAAALVDDEDAVAERARHRPGRRRALHADRHRDADAGHRPSRARPCSVHVAVASTARRPCPAGPTRSIRTADTLYSGIFDSGSSARFVSWLAAWRPGPVVGDEDRVGPDGRHDLGRQRHRPRAGT